MYLRMGDTWYPNFNPFKMDDLEWHLYLYYFNCLNPYLKIEMRFNTRSADPVQGNNFLYNYLAELF